MVLEKEEIKKIIPHREPMLLIDSVSALEPEDSLCAHFHVDATWEIFKGHFPANPVLPGVYAVECMAQAADILLLSMERYAGTIPFFIGIDNVRFIQKIRPGDTIDINVAILRERKERAIVTCNSEISVGGHLAAKGEVTLAMRK